MKIEQNLFHKLTCKKFIEGNSHQPWTGIITMKSLNYTKYKKCTKNIENQT